MKRLSLLLILCMLSMLAFAQTGSAPACDGGSGLFVNPASWAYPTIARDFSEDKVFVLCNDRSNNITITSISAAPTPPLNVVTSLDTCPDPGTLVAGHSCDITVRFVELHWSAPRGIDDRVHRRPGLPNNRSSKRHGGRRCDANPQELRLRLAAGGNHESGTPVYGDQ